MPEVPAIQPLDNPLTGLIRLQELQGLAQERQMRGQEYQALAQERQAKAQQLQQAQAAQERANQIISQMPRNQDGTFDAGALMQQMAGANLPLEHQEKLTSSIDGLNKVITSWNTAKRDHQADLANVLLEGHGPNDPVSPDSVHLGIAAAKAAGLATDDDEQRFTQMMAQGVDPEHVLKTVRGMGSKWAKPAEIKEVPAGGSLVSISPGGGAQTLFQGAPKAPTAEEDKAKYIGLQAKIAQKIPLTPEEQAWASGYEKAVTLGPEASAAASAERQLVGIQAAIGQQARAQAQQMTMESRREGFHEQETGRDKLTKEETKYHDALAQAQALRDTVASAQAGNKVAASMQSLETAMAAIRAQGLNRINAVEIGMPASAGNAWDRIQGWFGKATEGQPVPKDIQKDMTDFATMLERTAYNKYSTSHKSITGRYNLRDETPEPAPPSTVTGGPRTGGKGDPLGIR